MKNSKSKLKVEMKGGNKPASAAAIARFEREVGVRIPPEYAEFLSLQNGGMPAKRNLPFRRGGSADTTVRYFFGIRCDFEYDLELALTQYAGRVPNDMFPIAIDEGDNLVLMSNGARAKAGVFFWDHESELGKRPPVLIGRKLSTVLSRLRENGGRHFDVFIVTFRNGERFAGELPFKVFSVDRSGKVDVMKIEKGEKLLFNGRQRAVREVSVKRLNI